MDEHCRRLEAEAAAARALAGDAQAQVALHRRAAERAAELEATLSARVAGLEGKLRKERAGREAAEEGIAGLQQLHKRDHARRKVGVV